MAEDTNIVAKVIDHEARLTFLERTQVDLRDATVQLARDFNKLVATTSNLREMHERMNEISKSLEDFKERYQKGQVDALDQTIASLRGQRTIILKEILRTAGTVAVALLIYHFGMKFHLF